MRQSLWIGMLLIGVAACGAPPSSSSLVAPPGEVVEWGDVTRLHGPVIVREGIFSLRAATIPWSGYWYPLSRLDARSALRKHDLLTGRRALEFEEQRIRGESRPFLPWEGRCDAWALASVLHPEPRLERRVEREGLTAVFSIAEQKALWVHAHERLPEGSRVIFGSRNDGDGRSDFDDPAPAEFHRVLEVMLGEKKKPIIMDRDPRPPVWNTPVHAATMEVVRDLQRRSLFHVRAWVEATFPYDDDADSIQRLATILEYTYDFETAPGNDGHIVLSSRWTGSSRWNHPDFVTIPTDAAEDQLGSRNPEIDLDWLRENL